MEFGRASVWDQLEQEWLDELLEHGQTSSDPAVQMMESVVEFRYNLSRIGRDPATARIEFSVAAWDVICRSPYIYQLGFGGVPGRSTSGIVTQFMGVPVRQIAGLPGGVIVFRGPDGDVLRLVWLTDTPDTPNPDEPRGYWPLRS